MRDTLSVIANQARVGDITDASLSVKLSWFIRKIKSFREKTTSPSKRVSRGHSSGQIHQNCDKSVTKSEPYFRALMILTQTDCRQNTDKIRTLLRNGKGIGCAQCAQGFNAPLPIPLPVYPNCLVLSTGASFAFGQMIRQERS